MQLQNWHVLGAIALFVAGFVLMGWLIRWTDRRHWHAAQMETNALQAYWHQHEQRAMKLHAAVQAAQALATESGEGTPASSTPPRPISARPFADVAGRQSAAGAVRLSDLYPPAAAVPHGLSDTIFPDAPIDDRAAGASSVGVVDTKPQKDTP